ncbi:hypothetical protein AA0228_1866 [Gluconobacter frateurii NRIC 0228]|uniref:Uncharacterized protein n=1 Tax=Gluconobacter frateurii NRIC 0228 TaxID=1307946 RepID=A0ABQ0QCG0_9PROT|nr:hypothetical protein AA0228_1866 [Gluconobacter frateurii NRIC 0228]
MQTTVRQLNTANRATDALYKINVTDSIHRITDPAPNAVARFGERECLVSIPRSRSVPVCVRRINKAHAGPATHREKASSGSNVFLTHGIRNMDRADPTLAAI